MGCVIRMRVERLEYGDDPKAEYPEDFNSFKVYEIWSEPDVKIKDGDYEDLEEIDRSKESKRLAVAVEFSTQQGGYFFIEKQYPSPKWMNKVWKLLKEENWQGYSFNEIRGGCRRQIKVIKRKNYTAVIDKEKGKVLHNRGKKQGSGTVEKLENFWARPDERLNAYILKVKKESIKVRLSNGEKVWIKDKVGVPDEKVGENAELTVVAIPGNVTTETFGNVEKITDSLGITALEDQKLPCKLVVEVTDYDVEDRWPEAKSKFGYPLIEFDVGVGKVVSAHENVRPVKEKQDYHEKGTKWKITARKLILEHIDII